MAFIILWNIIFRYGLNRFKIALYTIRIYDTDLNVVLFFEARARV